MTAIFKAYERNAALILASEKWAKGYDQAPEQHGKLIKINARLQRKILTFFRDVSKQTNLIDWNAYRYALYEVKATRVDAYDISVIVKDVAIAAIDDTFINVVFDDLSLATTTGAQAGETIYKKALGISKGDTGIQDLVWEQVAKLVGKRIDPDGNIVDNPNADYRISDKTRDDIRSSIRNSLNLGEDVEEASSRLESTIKNPARAQTIANTETVNAYNKGLSHFGSESGAIGKEWTDNGATDECADNTADGVIAFEDNFSSGDSEPAAHPNCRCYIRLVYQNELDANPDLFG